MSRTILPHLRPWIVRVGIAVWAVVALHSPQLALAQTALADAEETSPRPFDVLLQHQEALGLTPDQLVRVERIRERLRRSNEPLVTRMLTLRSQWQQNDVLEDGHASSGSRERIRTAAAAVRARIARNNRTAMRAVNRVLTPAQRAGLRAIVQERQRGAGRQGDGSSSGDGGN